MPIASLWWWAGTTQAVWLAIWHAQGDVPAISTGIETANHHIAYTTGFAKADTSDVLMRILQ